MDDTKPISLEIERTFNVKITSIKRELEEKAREAERAQLKIQQEKERDRHSAFGYQSSVKISTVVSQHSCSTQIPVI